jgi:ribosomal protein L15
VRESEAEKSDDIKAVKTELREAKAKLQLAEDKELATRLLSEAGVPVKLLQVGDLLGMTESEMKREIEKTQAMIEAAGGRVVIPAGAKGGGSSKSAKLSESIKAMKAEAGLE